MDLCTYINFRNSIHNPKRHFRTLRDVVFDPSTLACTEHFAECIGEFSGRKYIFYAPISIEAIHYALRAQRVLHATPLTHFVVIPNEILLHNYFAESCSLIVETYPKGTLLKEALYTYTSEHLKHGLSNLKRALAQHNVCHTNLTPENIIIGEDYAWHPLRWYYAVGGKRKDYKAFKHLETLIDSHSLRDFCYYIPSDANTLHSPLSSYTTTPNTPLCERRRRIITSRGIGFIDEMNRLVVEDIYSSATDFVEDRSVVTLPSGKMGVINRHGRYIILPHYDNILYDIKTGQCKAYQGEEITTFDYLGHALPR